jgi:hypothetical protein
VKQDGLKMYGTHRLLVVADYVNTLGGNVHAIKKNTVVASNEIGIEVNAGKTKYMVMSRGRNADRIQNIKIDNGSYEKWKNSSIREQM